MPQRFNSHSLTTVYCQYNEKVKAIRNYRDIKMQLTFKFMFLCPSLCFMGLAVVKRVGGTKRTLLITQQELK